MVNNKLKFSTGGNAKLPSFITSFSLPSGWTCPGAAKCLARFNPRTKKIEDGKEQEFRCFAAMDERYPAVRDNRWHNLKALKACDSALQMALLIDYSLPVSKVVRVHVGGDFFSQDYFDAWMEVAKNNPKTTFYAYTKSLEFWVNYEGDIPENFKLNASRGGKSDWMIDFYGLKSAEVFFSEDEAIAAGLSVDHTDGLAYEQNDSFALLLHGAQPKGTKAGEALKVMKKAGFTGYGKG